ncbi:hypothetical protein BGX21_001155 [Mortierella sp. AD011]|nr:hypothetical protein BGX20_000023 [Mortierella sp. AD010]KAF9401624.1 hypothetical protein BGX21_001155 [Mortierella sp. AD011]
MDPQTTTTIPQANLAEADPVLAITACDSYEGQIFASKLADYLQAHFSQDSPPKQLICLARDLDKCCRLKMRSNCKVVQISYDDVESISKALGGVPTVVLVPEIEPQRVEWAGKVIDAMCQEKVARCILISSIGTDAIEKEQFNRFVQVEEKVKESALRWTILREGLPFQALLYWVKMIQDQRVLGMPIKRDIEFAPLDINNLGDALASVSFPSKQSDQDDAATGDRDSDGTIHVNISRLTLDETKRFDSQVYTITGPATVTGEVLVDKLSEALVKKHKEEGSESSVGQEIETADPITYKEITQDELREYLVKLRDAEKRVNETHEYSLVDVPGIRGAIKLFQQATDSAFGRLRLQRDLTAVSGSSHSSLTDWSDIDDDLTNGEGPDSHSCRCHSDVLGKNPKKCHRLRLGPPGDDEVDLILDLMKYIGEGRATFQSGDLEKITGNQGTDAKGFFEKYASNFRKSTVVSTIITLGVPVIDCDKLARIVVEPSHPAYKKLVDHFGTVILQNQEFGQPLDRYKFGTIIFPDAAQRRVANSIIHPAVRDEILKRLFKYWIMGTSLVVIDVPLLLEGELWRIVSDVIVVYCSPEMQLARIQSRDSLSEEDALARINAQRPLIEKVEYADHVIYNTSDLETLKESTLKVMETIKPNPFWTIMAYFPPFTLLMATWVIGKRHFKGDPRKLKAKNKGSTAAASSSSSSEPNPPAHAS